jgi:presenilin-like A22 family membrane protease
MKHSVKITLILLFMFFLTQLIGLAVINAYSPETNTIIVDGEEVNVTSHNLPFGLDPPDDLEPKYSLISIVVAIALAVFIMLLLMKIRAEFFLRGWFFLVVTIAIAITINAVLMKFGVPSLYSLLAAIPIAFAKIFRRNILIHNISELAVYPGVAVIFIPLLNIWTIIILLILISIYDIYAVWHAGFMQKMAKYQIKKLRIFSGFFIPYLNAKQRAMIKRMRLKDKKKLGNKKLRVSVAILGGGDVVFPIILAGVVLNTLGFAQALIISAGATLALGFLFYKSEKGKFYPAMPFITAGCFLALLLAYFI